MIDNLNDVVDRIADVIVADEWYVAENPGMPQYAKDALMQQGVGMRHALHIILGVSDEDDDDVIQDVVTRARDRKES